MDRVNGEDFVDIGGGKRGFRSESLDAGVVGTEVTAAWLNDVQENLAAVIEGAGLALAVGDWTLLYRAIQRIASSQGLANIPIDGNVSSAPGSPIEGAQYIVATGGSGIWAGRDGQIARWRAGAWTYEVPRAGRMASYWTGTRLVMLRHDGTSWAEDLATETAPGRVALGAVASQVGAQVEAQASLQPIYPEIVTPSAKLTMSHAGGVLTIDAGQVWQHRGLITRSTSDFQSTPDLANSRAFATVANKTYHLIWDAPGTGFAIPRETYPKGRFHLIDVADATYNPGALAETGAAFDTTFDRMLCARVVTSGANAVTWWSSGSVSAAVSAALVNRNSLRQTAKRTSPIASTSGSPGGDVVPLLWSRRPSLNWDFLSAEVSSSEAESLSSFGQVSGPGAFAPIQTRYQTAILAYGTSTQNYYQLPYEVRIEA